MPETIYYDGDCGLCHRFVQFVLARDPQEQFEFEHLSSLPAAERDSLPDSIAVRSSAGYMLTKSNAALYVIGKLGRSWRFLANAAAIFPLRCRDWVYDIVAANRYRIFGRRSDVCLMRSRESQVHSGDVHASPKRGD